MSIKGFELPLYTKKILLALMAAGHKAYVVGGAVRDLLLQKRPHDYDITTSATPEEVLAVCAAHNWDTIDRLGHNFGCVVIVLEGIPTEVTTFRGERYDASDAHKPSETWFCSSLREDLSRRDFTINAMAMDINGKVYDYFGGVQDLKNKILRTVGNAHKRYEEDALRMLRACRFVAQLGFTYVQEGCESLPPYGQIGTPYYLPHGFDFPAARCEGLSLERVRTELQKLLLAKYAGRGLMLMMATGVLTSCCRIKTNGQYTKVPILPEAAHLVGLEQNPKYHIYNTWEHTLLAIDSSPCRQEIRWTLLLHDLGKGLPNIRKLNKEGQPTDPGHEAESAKMAQAFLTRFCFNKEQTHLITWLVAQHMRFAPMLLTGERALLRWVRGEAQSAGFRSQVRLTQAYELLTEVFLADMGATHARDNKQLMAEGRQLGQQVTELARTRMPVAISDLALKGNSLLKLVEQPLIKDILTYLLQRVQSGNLANNYEDLLEAAKKYLSRRQPANERSTL